MCGMNSKRLRYPQHIEKTKIPLTPLDAAKVSAMDARTTSQHLL